MYDLCVVGAGLIGAAAARHASARAGVTVCLIGPDEPEQRSESREIYGAHYDEGRITRACSTNPVWSKLAIQSIKRYRELENQSGYWCSVGARASIAAALAPIEEGLGAQSFGTHFYNEVGCLMAGNKEFVSNVEVNASQQNVIWKSMTPDNLATSFPFLKISSVCFGIYEPENAGYVSPRNLLKAQKAVAAKQGCSLINEVVFGIERKANDSGSYFMVVKTETGRKIECVSVLIATGAFTTFRNLLPRLTLDVMLIPLTVALVEIRKSVAEQMRCMPSFIYDGQGHPDWFTDGKLITAGKHAFYLLPPVLYPNGRYYIKLGLYHDATRHLEIHTIKEAKNWFVNGSQEIAEKTKQLLVSILKDIPVESWRSDFCIVVETPTFLPYIDKVHGQLGVATGGNGHAAKSSDEIGRIAADMMFGEWNSDIPRDVFQVRYKNVQKANL